MGRRKGQKLSVRHIRNISEGLSGRRLSAEHKRHLSESLREKYRVVPHKDLTEDLTERIFGHWKVLNRVQGTGKTAKWLCKCVCGAEQKVLGFHLRKKRSKSCGCKRNESRMLLPGVSARNRLLRCYKRGARTRNLVWGLTDELFLQLTQQNCHYCGLAPTNVLTEPGGSYVYNGIDRMDSSLGYTEGNVVTCCKICQKAKSDMSYDAFISFVVRAGDFQTQKRRTYV